MSINYVIATYNGQGKRTHSHPLPKDVLNTHLEKLKASMQALSQITIMVAESPNDYKDYYDISEISSQFTVPIEMVKCDNYGYSPGQWLKAYELFTDKFDYYIFMEDDWCPGMQGFDDYLVYLYKHLFPEEIGLMCSLVEGSKVYKEKGGYPIHFGGGILLSTQTLQSLYSAHLKQSEDIGPRERLDKITSETNPGYNWERQRGSYIGGYYQLAFSHLFTLAGIEHEDYLHIDYKGRPLQMSYWADDGSGIRFYDKGCKKRHTYTEEQIYLCPVVPVQLANPSFIAHHTPFSIQSIEAERLKWCRDTMGKNTRTNPVSVIPQEETRGEILGLRRLLVASQLVAAELQGEKDEKQKIQEEKERKIKEVKERKAKKERERKIKEERERIERHKVEQLLLYNERKELRESRARWKMGP